MGFGNLKAGLLDGCFQLFPGKKDRLVMRRHLPMKNAEFFQAGKLFQRVVQRLFAAGRFKPFDRELSVHIFMESRLARWITGFFVHGSVSGEDRSQQSFIVERLFDDTLHGHVAVFRPSFR